MPSSSSSITPRPALVLGTIVFLYSRAPLPLSTSFLACHRLLCCLSATKKTECFTLVLNVNVPVLSCSCMPRLAVLRPLSVSWCTPLRLAAPCWIGRVRRLPFSDDRLRRDGCPPQTLTLVTLRRSWVFLMFSSYTLMIM